MKSRCYGLLNKTDVMITPVDMTEEIREISEGLVSRGELQQSMTAAEE